MFQVLSKRSMEFLQFERSKENSMNTADIQDVLIHMRHEEPERYYAFLNELIDFMEGLEGVLEFSK